MDDEKEEAEVINEYIHEDCWKGLKLLLQHGLLLTSENSNDTSSSSMQLLASWKDNNKIQFDPDGYVTLLDFGGKRLHRGFPISNPQGVFRYFSRLQTLNLAGTDLPIADILAIISTPPSNIRSTIQNLYLGGNALKDDGVTKLALSFFPVATSLIKLDLRYNDITGTGMKALCDALKGAAASTTTSSCNLQYLYMEGNQIGDEGSMALAELLQQQSSNYKQQPQIKEIFLGSNQIQAAGGQAIANSLYVNKTITKLYLDGNNIGEIGANAFSTVLEELNGDTKLRNLYVDNNNIGKEGSKRLAKALNSDTVIA